MASMEPPKFGFRGGARFSETPNFPQITKVRMIFLGPKFRGRDLLRAPDLVTHFSFTNLCVCCRIYVLAISYRLGDYSFCLVTLSATVCRSEENRVSWCVPFIGADMQPKGLAYHPEFVSEKKEREDGDTESSLYLWYTGNS